MKITIVMGFFLPIPAEAGGSTEKSWEHLALEFSRRGHEVTIISRHWRDWPRKEVRDGVRHLRLDGYDHTGNLSRNLWLDFKWSLRVFAALPPADVTIVNCVALPVWLGWIRRGSGRLVVMPGRMPKGQYRFYRRLDRVLAVSSSVRAAVLAENARLDPIMTICGYPIHWGRLARPRPAANGAIPVTFGFIGRIHREKGLELLADALAILARRPGLPAWRLVLCGPVEVAEGGSGIGYAEQLRARLGNALPTGNFEMRPPDFTIDGLTNIYRELDVFCYPSLAAQGETFGVAVIEAMAAGAVPVVSELPCFRDYLRPGENGESFDHLAPDAAQRLADVLSRLLTEPARRKQLAAAAQESVRRYDFPAHAGRLLEDFSTLK